jgi:hypoxanthine phosphoribosyltransferase
MMHMPKAAKAGKFEVIISAQQIDKRLREMAHQISDDYAGKTIHALAVLENSFMFLSDLARFIEVPMICQFIKPRYNPETAKSGGVMEIFFSHDLDISGQHVLVVEGLVHSGLTTEFLMNDLRRRGAASVKLASLVERQSARRVQLQPDYFGFMVDSAFLVGYGLGSREQIYRNLPFLAIEPGDPR